MNDSTPIHAIPVKGFDGDGTIAFGGALLKAIEKVGFDDSCLLSNALISSSAETLKMLARAVAIQEEEPDGPDRQTRGACRVEWVRTGEGWSGEYDPSDPRDVELLRFDVQVLLETGFVTILDASYCTQVPAATDDETRKKLAAVILAEVSTIVNFGLMRSLERNAGEWSSVEMSAGAFPQLKHVVQSLSWINPSWADRYTEPEALEVKPLCCPDCGGELVRYQEGYLKRSVIGTWIRPETIANDTERLVCDPTPFEFVGHDSEVICGGCGKEVWGTPVAADAAIPTEAPTNVPIS